MYSREEKIRAVEVFIRYDLTPASVIRELEYQATFSFMTRLVERMDTIDGYVPGETSVAFAGVPSNNELFKKIAPGFPQRFPSRHLTIAVNLPATL